MHVYQLRLQAQERRATGVDLEKAFLRPAVQVYPDRHHVFLQLVWRFLKGQYKATFAPGARGVDKMLRYASLARPGSTCHADSAAFIVAFAAQHLVKAFNPRRDSIFRSGMREPERRYWQEREAKFSYDKRKL